MEEIWKSVKGFEGIYEVSNLGRVRSLDRVSAGGARRRGVVLKPSVGEQGYPYVILKFGKKQKTIKIHRLVAAAFVPNPHGFPVVNHKDENRGNASADNLEWCSQKYNANYNDAPAKRGKRQRKRVNQLDLSGNLLATYQGLCVAERETGVRESKISMCCNGRRKTAGKFLWAFSD